MKTMKKSLVGILSASVLIGNVAPYVANAQEGINPTLTLTPNATENYIQLDWGMTDKSQPYSYQIKQIKEGATEPQSIQAKETVKVLNVYPEIGTDVTYTTSNGVTRTLPKAGSLEQWMEEPNAENEKGYGMGLIDVDPIGIAEFNANPEKYLKDENGEWKYDTVFFGSWDSNGSKDISDAGFNLIVEYVESGRGLLIGHDVIANGWTGPKTLATNFDKLMPYLNLEEVPQEYINKPVEEIPDTYQAWGSDQVIISKKGLLTNYPWKIGEVGTTLNIPYTHTGWIVSKGDNWMKFANIEGLMSGISEYQNYMLDENLEMNSYLSTWNNTAMIQTGHSSGQATPDEQKLLANTLFYLSQITTETSWKDRSGQDLEAPNVPTVQNATYNKATGNLQFSYQSVVDNGSDYTYQVEATGQNDEVKRLSEPVTATITSGLKGYSIAVDTNPTTNPDNVVETTETQFSVSQSFSENFYIHVGAVDNQGNMSVAHYEVDITAPEKALLTASPSSPTNGNVFITASFPSSATSKKYSIGEAVIGSGKYNKPVAEGEHTIYLRGSGYNQKSFKSDTRVIEVDGNNMIDLSTYDHDGYIGRGLQLVVLDRNTLQKKFEDNYDTHLQETRVNDLANKLNSLGSDDIVLLASEDSWSWGMNENLRQALLRVGASSSSLANESRIPYVLIGVPGIGAGNGVEHITSNAEDAPYAEVAVKVSNGMVSGLFYNYTNPIEVKENGVKVSAKGIDTAGNHSAVSSYTVNNIDRNAPTVQSVRQDITSSTNQDVTVTVTGSDAEFGVKRMYKPDNSVKGLKATYYSHPSVVAPPTTIGTKLTERIEPTINHSLTSASFGEGLPIDFFTVVWEGLVYAPETGTYTFETNSDDGVQLSVNNKLIVDKWVQQSPTVHQGSITLEGGKWHPIKLKYYESHGGASISLSWKYPSKSTFEIVPSDNLTPLGEYVDGNSVNKTVSENGTHLFVVEDHAGNQTVTNATVNNIDKIAPEKAILKASTTQPTNQPVTVTATFPSDVAKKEVRVNEGEWELYSSGIVMNSNGAVEVRGYDVAGNISEVSSYDVTNIDTVSPQMPTFVANKETLTNTDVEVTIQYPSDAHVKEYRLGNGSWTSYAKPIVVSSNTKIEARAKDLAGNYSVIGSYEVKNIDKTAPNTPQFSADKTNPTNTDVKVTVSFPSDSSLKQVRVNEGAWITYSTPINFSSNGKIEARAIDEAGNLSAIGIYEVTNIDKVKPLTPSLSADKNNPTNTSVVVTATFPNDVVKKEVRVNNGTWSSYSTPITMTDNGRVEVRGTDEAGNTSEINSFDVVNIDKVSPTTPTLSPNTTSLTNQNVSVSITYSNDATGKEYRVNGGAWSLYSEPVSLSGNGKVEARAKDEAGNYSAIGSYDVTNIDKLKPLKATLSADTTETTNQPVTVTATFPLDVVRKEMNVNNEGWKSYSSMVFEKNGTIEVRGYDQAGNVSDVSRYEVNNIDLVIPKTPSHIATENQNKFTLNGESDSTLYYQVDNGSWTKFSNEVILNDGSYTLQFKAIDRAGNESEVSSVTVTMYRDALATATKEVENAEKEPTQEKIDLATEKVNAIPHNAPEYQPLMDRLADLQALVDVQKAIEKAIETRTDEDLKVVQEKIELLDSSNPIIIDLMDEVEKQFEEAQILTLVAKERYDLLSSEYEMSKPSYTALVQIYYAIKYTGDTMYKMAQDKVVLVSSEDKYYDFVHEQYNNLITDYDQFVEERIQTDAEIKAEASVQVMEGKYDPTLALNTQNLINAVEDATIRADLQKRLDIAKAKYEASLLDKATQSAITAVEKAESMKQSYYVTEAYKKVNVLTDETLKAELTTRLQKVEAQIAYDRQVTDATRLVQFAEQYKSQYYIDSAQKKIDALPEGEDKTSLQQRLDTVKSGMATSDQATVIKNATNYVSLAQTMKTQYYVDKAQGYVNQITDPVKKAELQAKLDAIVVK